MAIKFYEPVGATVYTMPTTLSLRGKYQYVTPVLRYNGLGQPITASRDRATWTWQSVSASDYAWIVTTLLGGGMARRFTSVGGGNVTLIWNDLQNTEVEADQLIVHKPTYEAANGARYTNVQMLITGILLAT